jgi:hypothetical protein
MYVTRARALLDKLGGSSAEFQPRLQRRRYKFQFTALLALRGADDFVCVLHAVVDKKSEFLTTTQIRDMQTPGNIFIRRSLLNMRSHYSLELKRGAINHHIADRSE